MITKGNGPSPEGRATATRTEPPFATSMAPHSTPSDSPPSGETIGITSDAPPPLGAGVRAWCSQPDNDSAIAIPATTRLASAARFMTPPPSLQKQIPEADGSARRIAALSAAARALADLIHIDRAGQVGHALIDGASSPI